MHVNGTKVSVVTLFVIMFAAVVLQIMVFLDPQNNLATGGVIAGEGFISQGNLFLVIAFTGFILGIQGFRYKKKK